VTFCFSTHRRAFLWLLLIISLPSLGFGPPVLRSIAFNGPRLYPYQIRSRQKAIRPPHLSATAAILADLDTERILLDVNAHRRLPPASTTKIMTALLALERTQLDEVVVVPDKVQTEGVNIGLVPGERITLETLLYGLLLASGNDAAITIAEHVGDSVDKFVALMNARAAELGLHDTHFTNPHGLDAPDHYSSAYDLFLLTKTALANPTFAHMVATPAIAIGGRTFVNRNQLLGPNGYPGADGVKTGTTPAAGQCLVASVSRDGHRALAVVLGSGDRYTDAKVLFDHYFAYYGWQPLTLFGNALDWLDDGVGERFPLLMETRPEAFLADWERPWVHPYRAVTTTQTLLAGMPAGYVRFLLWDDMLAEAPLRLGEP